jgi:glycosyltransferase involved in cell wall biosynthesis
MQPLTATFPQQPAVTSDTDGPRLLLAYFAEHSLDDVMATLKGIRRARPGWRLSFLGSRRAVEFAHGYIARWELGAVTCHVAPLVHLPLVGGHAVGTYLVPGFQWPGGPEQRADYVLAYMQPFIPHAWQFAGRLRRLEPRPTTAFTGIQNIRLALGPVLRSLAKATYQAADWVAAIGPEQRDVLRLAGYRGPVEYGLHGYDADLFHPGVDPAPEVRQRFGDTPVLAYLGRLETSKGVHTLLEAFAALRLQGLRTALLVVGDGPEAGPLAARVRALGLEADVWLTGRVPYDRMPGYMRAAHVVVVPSEIRMRSYLCSWLRQPWREQFGRVIAEAMACGRPVVGSDSGEIPRLVGREDMLFQSERPEALAACLVRVLRDAALRQEVGQANATRALRWSLDRIAAGLCERMEEYGKR